MKRTLHTKFGNARVQKGYYKISSKKEGNNNKYLHRLIFEDFYGFEVPKGFVVHHKDENKLNNCILNLQLMHETDHLKLHNVGENNAMYGLKGELSPRFGKRFTNKTKSEMCKNRGNKTGFFRVSKLLTNSCDQGYTWVYRYYEGKSRRTVSSISLKKLKEKVLAKGLEWFIIDEDLAIETMRWSN